jgi:hypothetical protein
MTRPMADVTNPLDAARFKPAFFLYHKGGPWLRAVFATANDAYVWQEGNRGRRWAEMFFITDASGAKVVLKDQEHHPGHAYAILEALERSP